jgi:hypothetical protein
VVLLTPLLGVAPATALALLARVVHTAADGLMAAGSWAAARQGRVATSELDQCGLDLRGSPDR